MDDAGDNTTAPPPRQNPLLLGHAAAERALLQAWRSNRLHHAWLITGPRGIGKATLAFRFARFVLGGGQGDLFGGAAETLDVPPSAPVFRQVASGGHPDLLTIERTYDEKNKRLRTEVVVDQVRELGAFLHLKAAAGGWRVVIIDSADDLNRNAEPALLKLLEEPPRQALLLLVCHAPGRVLPTIRSRCRRLALMPLGEIEMKELLVRYCPDVGDGDRALLLRLAAGSIGRALDLAAAGGVELYRAVAGQLLRLPKLDAMAVHALGDRLGQKDAADRFRLAAELVEGWLARLIRARATGQAGPELIEGESARMTALAARRSLDQWLELWEKISRLFARTEAVNLDRKQVWVSAMLDIAG
jgi:DNA polymerase-3 subunit delta'